MSKHDAKAYGSGGPGDLARSMRERDSVTDALSPREALRASITDDEWAAFKASELGGGGGPNSGYDRGRKAAQDGFHLFGTDLFGDAIEPNVVGSLREKFMFPPFSVLNAREGPWQARKRAWISIGIRSELGRGATVETITPKLEGVSGDGAGRPIRSNTYSFSNAMQYAGGFEDSGVGSSGTSIFDPVLTEMSYRWFCPPGGLILDPFAGGSVRGIVAGLLGFRYFGIDLRPEQVAANEAQRAELAPEAAITWQIGDSNAVLDAAPDADFVFSCPPYGDLEVYSDDPADLSTMTYEGFATLYRSIIAKAVARLKPNRFACFVVGEYRDKKTGMYRGFVPLTIEAFEQAGAQFYNEAILITAVGSLPIRITKQFEASRKLGKTHQNVLVFCKGDAKLAAAAMRGEVGDAAKAAIMRAPKPAVTRPAAAQAPAAPRPTAPAGPKPSALSFVMARPAAPPTAPEPVKTPPLRQPAPPWNGPVPTEPPAAPTSPAATEPMTADLPPEELRLRLQIRGHRLLVKDGRFFVTEPERLTPDDVAALQRVGKDALLALAEEWKDEHGQSQTQTSEKPPSGMPDVQTTQDERGEGRQETTHQGRPEGQDELARPADARPFVTTQAPATDSTPATESASTIPIEEDKGLLGFNAGPIDDGTLFDEPPAGQTLAQLLGAEPRRASSYDGWRPDEPPDLTGIDEIVLNFATDGTDWVRGHRPGGLTVSSMDGRLCRFLPFRFQDGNLDEEQIKRWAREQLRGKKITNAKTKFDVHMARVWGVDLEAQGCTFSDIHHTAAICDDHRKRFAIDVLADDYLPNLPKVARVDESRHLENHAADVAEREKFTAELVWRLKDAMMPQLRAEELLDVQALEDAVIPAVVEMEKNGSPIDMELLERFERECDAEHGRLLRELSDEVGFAFAHTAKDWQRLFEKLGLPPTEGNGEEVLEGIDHPTVTKAYYASQVASLNSKTFKAYKQHIIDNVLRFEINQLKGEKGGTVSGRFSIGYVQQVPNHDNHHATFGEGDPDDCHGLLCKWFPRKLFVAANGHPYLEGDAAQIEFRLLVHRSKNPALLQAYKDDPWTSYHKQMQAELRKYKPDQSYSHTKAYNFAAQYGAKEIKLATMMKFITEAEANEIRQAQRWDDPRLKTIKEIVAAVKRAHPEAGQLFDLASHLAKPECDKYCKKSDDLHRKHKHRGYVRTALGRRSRFPTNYKTHIGLNRVLQGDGADIMKKKLVEMHRERAHTGFLMRLTVHDAIGGDAQQPETLERVREVLNRQTTEMRVPILWTANTGANWAECK